MSNPTSEHADLADSYTDPDAAGPLLETLRINQETTAPLLFALQAAWFYGRRKRYDEAAAIFAQSVHAEGVYLSGETARRTTAAYIAAVSEFDQGHSLATQAVESARKQAATRWLRIADLIAAFCGSPVDFGTSVKAVGSTSPWNVTHVADLVCRRLDELDQSVLPVISDATKLHPGRWRFVLRDRIASARVGEGLVAARLLEPIGDSSDIQRLRDFARRQRKLAGAATLGRHLARKLAERVDVEVQNCVSFYGR